MSKIGDIPEAFVRTRDRFDPAFQSVIPRVPPPSDPGSWPSVVIQAAIGRQLVFDILCPVPLIGHLAPTYSEVTTMKRVLSLVSLALFSLILAACADYSEEVDVSAVLPGGTNNEILHAWPEFKAVLVSESDYGVAVGDRYLVVEGVEDEEARERFARYVAGYLNDPEKKDREAQERADYDALPASDKLASFVERMEGHYEGFDYEWTSLEDGNSFVEYGDNGLYLSGVEEEGARREIGNYIYRLQQEIDASHTGEGE